MGLENFLYLHCGEHRKICSADIKCDNYLYSGGAGRKALWRAIKKAFDIRTLEGEKVNKGSINCKYLKLINFRKT